MVTCPVGNNHDTITGEAVRQKSHSSKSISLEIVRYIAIEPYWPMFLIHILPHGVMCYNLATDRDIYNSTGGIPTPPPHAMSTCTKQHQPTAGVNDCYEGYYLI